MKLWNEFIEFWPIYILGVFLSLICHIIYTILHRKEKRGQELSEKGKQWLSVMKPMRIGFLILFPLIVLCEIIIDPLAIILFIGAIFALPSLIKNR